MKVIYIIFDSFTVTHQELDKYETNKHKYLGIHFNLFDRYLWDQLILRCAQMSRRMISIVS